MTIFGSGVASGDATATSVVLWTRVDGAGASDVHVDWHLRTRDLHDPDRAITRSGTAVARSGADHTVHVDVDGLIPGTAYEYGFTCGDQSISGTTRTLPEAAGRFRLAVACCSRWGWPGHELFDAIAAEEPDLLLHLGDSIYEVGEIPPAGGSTDPPWDCHTLNDYRRRYRQHRSDPRLRRLLAAVPVLAVWDDHEVVDNGPDPGASERRRVGRQAWAEWMPSRRTDEARPLDRYHTIGGLLDLAVVDSRFAGRAPATVDGPGDEDDAPGSILGARQWERVERFAASAEAPWFVFANQVQVGPMTLAARPALVWPPWERVVNPDQWDGYVADRDRLYRLLRTVPGRPVVVSGDLHSAWARTLADEGVPVTTEFTVPSISGLTYAAAVREKLPIPTRLLRWWLTRLNHGIDHLDLDTHGFVVCDVTPDRFETTFVMVDGKRHTVVLDREG